MKEKERECQTFKLITRAGLTKLKRCPYDEGCDGQRCPLLERKKDLIWWKMKTMNKKEIFSTGY